MNITGLFERLADDDYEEIVVVSDRPSGLKAFLVIHDTTRGPAHGGTRTRRYPGEAEALEDGLRLARAMTYKAAMAELPAGGGKIVVCDHPGLDRAAAFHVLGRFVDSLGGRLFTGGDLGTHADDLARMRAETPHVADAADPRMGDLSEPTARGVFAGLRACTAVAGVDLATATVAIQGVGGVGYHLAALLRAAGARLVVSDNDPGAVRRAVEGLGAEAVAPDAIYDVPAEVFAPCAVGGVLDGDTIGRLRARIVCGGANNVLGTPADGEALVRRGIVYAPDYVVNAGALIHGASVHLLGKTDNDSAIEAIEKRTRALLEQAMREGRSAQAVADDEARARLVRPKGHQALWWPCGGGRG